MLWDLLTRLKLRIHLFLHAAYYHPSYCIALRALTYSQPATTYEIIQLPNALTDEQCDGLIPKGTDQPSASICNIQDLPRHTTHASIRDDLLNLLEKVIAFPREFISDPYVTQIPPFTYVYDTCYHEKYTFTMEKGIPPKFATLVVYLDEPKGSALTHFLFANTTLSVPKGTGLLYLHMDTNLTLSPESIRYDKGPRHILTMNINIWNDIPEWKERLTKGLTESRSACIDPLYLETIFMSPKFIHNTKVDTKKDM